MIGWDVSVANISVACCIMLLWTVDTLTNLDSWWQDDIETFSNEEARKVIEKDPTMVWHVEMHLGF